MRFGNGQYAQGDLAALKQFLNSLGAKLTVNNTADGALQAALREFGSKADPKYLKRAVNPSGQKVWLYQADGLLASNQNADLNPFKYGNTLLASGVKTNSTVGTQTNTANLNHSQQSQVRDTQSMAAAFDIDAAYDAAGENYKKAENAAYEAASKDILAQNDNLRDPYNDVRSAAYENAQLQAAGDNEALAAIGLYGNLFDSAQPGVSDTCRITLDADMINDVYAIMRAEQSDADEEAQNII